MKTYLNYLFLLSFLFLVTRVAAQTPVNDGWSEMGNASYNSEIFSMAFVDSNIGYAVGSGGAYLKTTDGGTTWTAQNIGVVLDLKQIIFRNDTLGYMHGSHGGHLSKFLRTIDGGISWVEIPSTGGAAIYNMFFLSDSVGWLACGSKYFKTTNRGDTWDITLKSAYNTIFDINFISSDTGFLASNSSNYLQRTTDGGNTWEISNSDYISDIEFPSSDNGYISKLTGSLPRMLRTIDQGENWTDASIGISLGIKGMKFINDSTGFCWGSGYGRIYMTNNYGDSWSQVYNKLSAQINGVQISPSGVLYAFGKNGLILNSTNGTVWDTTHVGQINGTLNRVAFTDDNTGYAVGENGIVMKTMDAAVTWEMDNIGTTNHLRDINFISPSTGFIIGDGSKIYKTSNAGVNWVSRNSGYTSSQSYGIEMVNGSIGYAGGQNGVFKTINGGDNWTITSLTNSSYSIQCLGVDTVFSGHANKVFSSYNGGFNWNEFPLAEAVFALHFFDSQYGFIGNSWGRVYKTTDGGATVTQKYNCTFAINELVFINDTTGYFVADGGYIGKTVDAGETWVQVASGTTRDLQSICFSSDGTGYIVGKEGLMMRKAVVPTHTISFNIINLGGDPIIDATLKLNGASYPVGTYSVSGLIEGSYQYQISKTGYLTQSGTVHLVSDSVIDITLANLDIPVALNATDITHLGFTANWNTVSQADSYLLYVSNDDFATYLPTYDGLLLTGTSKIVDGLLPETTYSFKLKSQNTHGITEFSNTISVVTLPLPTYSLSFDVVDLEGNPIMDATLMFNSTSHPAGNYSVSSLIEGSYDYEISKTGYLTKSGTVHLVSDSVIHIELLIDLDIPVALDATDISHFGFTANWNAVGGADGYLLFVSADDFVTHLPGYDGLLLTGTSKIIDGLLPETTYSYKLKSQNTHGITEFSNTISVVTLPLPTYSLSFVVVDLEGDPITDATLMFNSTSHPAGNYSVSSLIEGSYDYEISKTGYLTKSGTVHLVSDSVIHIELLIDLDIPVALDATDISHSGFTANWNAVSQADSYLLFVSADDFVTHLPGYDASPVSATSKIIEGLLPETTYSYKLKSQNDVGISEFSNVISLTTTQAVGIESNIGLGLKIYPNPASQEVIVLSGDEMINSISIVDLQGKVLMNLILTINPNELQKIDISNITKGYYFVIVTCDNGNKKIAKLIIE
ncbi:MAG: YCF48-related protein [Bacteroidales bacterium]|nr:YCF48-related protein [Bacteroidales bacterium]